MNSSIIYYYLFIKIKIKMLINVFIKVKISGADEEDARAGRFLNYFITITKTNTITSYSATSTVASVACTPYEFTMDMCPG